MKTINRTTIEKYWNMFTNNNKVILMLKYSIGIASVFYITFVLYLGFDEIKKIPLNTLFNGLIPSLLLFLISLIVQFIAWTIILHGKFIISRNDLTIFATSIILRRLPGGFWHWVGRSSLYKKSDNLSLKETTVSNFIEWSSLVLTGFASYFLIQKNLMSLVFIFLSLLIIVWWFNKNFQLKAGHIFFSFLLIVLYLGSWLIGGLIFIVIGDIVVPYEISTSIYLETWFLSSSISMIFIFLPAGFGIREISISALLQHYIGLPTALVFALLIRIVFVLSEFLWGYLGYLMISIYSKKNSHFPN